MNVSKVVDPAIVAEVLSPSTEKRDLATKLGGYFRVPSILHYLILDPDESMLIHHARRGDGVVETATISKGRGRLDPPGLDLEVASLFAGGEARERMVNLLWPG